MGTGVDDAKVELTVESVLETRDEHIVYHIFRRGSVVTRRWGGVTVSSRRIFHWASNSRPIPRRFGSQDEARRFMHEQLQMLMSPSEGYSRLPPGRKISPRGSYRR
jgi:hypothetical protein